MSQLLQWVIPSQTSQTILLAGLALSSQAQTLAQALFAAQALLQALLWAQLQGPLVLQQQQLRVRPEAVQHSPAVVGADW